MAVRRLSAQFVTIMQRSSVGNGSGSVEGLAAPSQGSFFASGRLLHSEAQAKADNEHTHEYEKEKMNSEGGGTVDGSFKKKSDELKQRQEAKKDVVSEGSQKINEAKETVKGKAAEAGEKANETAEQAKETVKGKSAEVGGKVSETSAEAKGQVSKNMDTAKDMFKDVPQKVSETATGLKEVGVEAAKAVKRDADKLAQKTGLKTE